MKRVLILAALLVPLGRAAADTKDAEARWAEFLVAHDDAVKTLRSVKDKATATAARDACDRIGRQLVDKEQAAANAFRMLAGSDRDAMTAKLKEDKPTLEKRQAEMLAEYTR